MNPHYLDTARLLIQVAPLVFEDGVFALKGGTAINLFMRDMPRLSVDLDLVFTDHSVPREQALQRIGEALRKAAARLNARGFQTRTQGAADATETKLLVRGGPIEVKVEVNFVMRGTVNPVRMAALVPMRARSCWLSSRSPWRRWRTSMAASWSQRWTGSILGTCSTSCNSLRTRASRPESGERSWCTSPATTGRFTKFCSRPNATLPRSTSAPSKA